MTEKKEPTQHTPKGAAIPVPKRGDVMRDLLRVAKRPAPGDRGHGAGSARDDGGAQEK